MFLVLGAKSNILTRSKHNSSLICVNLCHLRIILRLQPAKALPGSLSMASSSIGDFTEGCPQIAQIFADQMERYYVHQHFLNDGQVAIDVKNALRAETLDQGCLADSSEPAGSRSL